MDENERKVVELRIDPDTGDVVGALYEGDKIISKRQIEESCKKVQFGKGKRYIKLFDETIDALKLAPSERLLMDYLLKYISYSDNVLRYDNKLIDIQTIAILLDREYESTRQLVKKLIDKGVLAVVKTASPTFVKSQKNHLLKAYIFNPYIATRSVNLDKAVYDIFTNAGWNDNSIGSTVDKNIIIKLSIERGKDKKGNSK